MKITIYHGTYGCETGCCGHWFEVEDAPEDFMWGHERFNFDHPWKEDFRQWAENLVSEEFGAEHVKDLVWDECIIHED